MTWRGRSNLYAKIGAYLESTRKGDGRETITDFEHWQETATEVREKGSVVAATPVWKAAQPLQRLIIDQEDPTRAFALASAYLKSSSYGARQGPSGTLLSSSDGFAEYRSAPVIGDGEPEHRPVGPQAASRTQVQKEGTEVVPKRGTDSTSSSLSVASAGGRSEVTYPTDDESDMSTMPAMPPMATAPATDPEAPAPVGDPRNEASAPNLLAQDQPGRGRVIEEEAKGAVRSAQGGDSGLSLIRSAEQFISTLNRLGAKGGVLTIAHGADLELPTTELAGTAPWRIEAEPGGRRPRLRFRPSEFVSRSPTAWGVMFQLRSGSLRLRGLDLVIQDQDKDAIPVQSPGGHRRGGRLGAGCRRLHHHRRQPFRELRRHRRPSGIARESSRPAGQRAQRRRRHAPRRVPALSRRRHPGLLRPPPRSPARKTH